MAMQKSTKVAVGIVSFVIILAIIIIFIVKKKAATQVNTNRAIYVPPTANNPKGGTDFGPVLNTVATSILDWWKSKNNQYVQTAPIDVNGCDALGNDYRGVPCTNVSTYVQVQPVDANGCDANGYNAIGVPCI